MTSPSSPRITLRHLPLAARLTLAAVLISVGIGYLTAIVQLHFQHASPGSLFPTGEDAVRIFHGHVGGVPVSPMERLLEASETEPFNGTGQMSAAFTTRSDGWKPAIKKKAIAMSKGAGGNPDLEAAEKELRKERRGEIEAVLAWVKAGADMKDYKDDKFSMNPGQHLGITKEFLQDQGENAGPEVVKIRTLLDKRCVRCHSKEGGDDAKAGAFPLQTAEDLKKYVVVETSSAMSLNKLAQTTHTHLLGFSMLYGITGLILAFSSYPMVVRVILAPLPLVAQVADISCWWLARLDEPYGPMFAGFIEHLGMVVAAGLFLQIMLSLFNLFGKVGSLVLVLMMGAAGFGAYVAKEKVIDPYIAREKAAVNKSEAK